MSEFEKRPLEDIEKKEPMYDGGYHGVFSDDKKNIISIESSNGEEIIDIEYIRGGYDVYEMGMLYAGYIEEKGEDGVYRMYMIHSLDGQPYSKGFLQSANKEFSKLNIGRDSNPIDINSNEYFKVWSDINFYIYSLVLQSTIRNGGNPTDEFFRKAFNSGGLRIVHLEKLRTSNQIGQEIFNKYKPLLLEMIVKQITDERFWKVSDPVTKQELESYRIYFLIEPEKFQILMDAYYDFHGVTQEQREKERDITNRTRRIIEDLRYNNLRP